MASFDVSDSIKSYLSDRSIKGAVDALNEVLHGESQPEMDWHEARAYNQALLMAAQVRADYAELLFDLWDMTFGDALKSSEHKFKVDFEWENCTPEAIWEQGIVWCILSRHGLQSDSKEPAYELYVWQDDESLLLSVAKWDRKKSRYQDFNFDPLEVSSRTRWHSVPDEGRDVVGKSIAIDMATFIAEPDQKLLELKAAAREMIDYLAKIV